MISKNVKRIVKAAAFDLAFWAITIEHLIDGSI
jgi:hypothetical protein